MAGDHSAPMTLLERWRETEPLRLHLYGITVPALAVAVAYGWLTTEQLGAWTAVAAAMFLGSTAAGELARRVVWAPATVDRTLRSVDRDAYREGVHDGQETPDGPARTEQFPAAAPGTATMQSLGRCRRVEAGSRCTLPAHPDEVAHVF